MKAKKINLSNENVIEIANSVACKNSDINFNGEEMTLVCADNGVINISNTKVSVDGTDYTVVVKGSYKNETLKITSARLVNESEEGVEYTCKDLSKAIKDAMNKEIEELILASQEHPTDDEPEEEPEPQPVKQKQQTKGVMNVEIKDDKAVISIDGKGNEFTENALEIPLLASKIISEYIGEEYYNKFREGESPYEKIYHKLNMDISWYAHIADDYLITITLTNERKISQLVFASIKWDIEKPRTRPQSK